MVDFDFNLENENILLRPLESQDFNELSILTKKPEMWYYFTSDLSNPEVLKNWIDAAVEERNAKIPRQGL